MCIATSLQAAAAGEEGHLLCHRQEAQWLQCLDGRFFTNAIIVFCFMFFDSKYALHCIVTAQERDSTVIWYSAKYDSFFISTEVVPDQDGSWQGVLTYGRLEVVDQPYGLGAGKVFTPWSSKIPTDVFVLQPLELALRYEVEELQAANDLLKQQMASMQRLYDVTVARGTASGSKGSSAANWLQAGGSLGFFWISVLGGFFFNCCLAFPPSFCPCLHLSGPLCHRRLLCPRSSKSHRLSTSSGSSLAG